MEIYFGFLLISHFLIILQYYHYLNAGVTSLKKSKIPAITVLTEVFLGKRLELQGREVEAQWRHSSGSRWGSDDGYSAPRTVLRDFVMYSLIYSIFKISLEVHAIIILVLQMRKPRYKKATALGYGPRPSDPRT